MTDLETTQSQPAQVRGGDLERILDIPLQVCVELGRRRIRISELLQLAAGSTVELEAAAGTTLSLYANGVLLARGDAVLVDGRYGIRVTEIVSPEERVLRLGGSEAPR